MKSYCFHPVNVATTAQSQRDHIKRNFFQHESIFQVPSVLGFYLNFFALAWSTSLSATKSTTANTVTIKNKRTGGRKSGLVGSQLNSRLKGCEFESRLI